LFVLYKIVLLIVPVHEQIAACLVVAGATVREHQQHLAQEG